MRTVRLCSKSTPFKLSMNVVTKCLRVCSPSVTISMPAASGSASQPGLGRLPAMVVCSSKGLRARRDVPRSEAAADVHLGTVAVADQLEATLACGPVCRDPIADLGRAVTDGGQALVQEVDQR